MIYQDLPTVWETLDQCRSDHARDMLNAAHEGNEPERIRHENLARSFGQVSSKIFDRMSQSQRTFLPFTTVFRRLRS